MLKKDIARKIFLFFTLLSLFFSYKHAIAHDQKTPSDRITCAQNYFDQYPQYFPKERRQSILNGVVVLGMTPFEAKLAAGAFYYKVSADKTKWGDNANPFKVMWAQSIEPDNSEIWMMFKNTSQFSSANGIVFRVYFERGHAIRIEKI